MRRRRHAPLRRAVRVHHRQAGLHHVGGEGGVPEDLLGDVALRRHRARLRRRSCPAPAAGHTSSASRDIWRSSRPPPGRWCRRRARRDEPTGRQPSMRMPHSSTGRPFGMPLSPLPAIDSQASVKRQPSDGILLAVVHVAIDLDAVDLLDVVGEELGDVLIGRPVHGNAEIVAVLGLELGLVVGIGEPVVAEPVEVRELLVGQLVELAVRRGGERLADEVVDVERRDR